MNDFEFDDRARTLHEHSLQALSPRVQAQLHNRLRAAVSAPRGPRHVHRWGLAAAAVLALAIGFGVPWTSIDESTVAIGNPVAVAEPASPDATLATLEQDPDFYLWLASADAVALASE
ncbi:MAG: hypothetical protein M3Y70_06745 [Pseudomonadota bacterium]|nr:hypothetical protein [Pseudomonadota bacterium]